MGHDSFGGSLDRFKKMSAKADVNTNKGKFSGDCNRMQCQAPGATWWNFRTSAYYCQHCAHAINEVGTPFIVHDPDGINKDKVGT